MFGSTLFSHQLRLPGWVLLISGLLLGVAYIFFELELSFLDLNVWSIGGESSIFSQSSSDGLISLIENNITDEVASILTLVGAVLVAFSEEVMEDEYYKTLRFEAMVWALKVQAVVLLLGTIFLYDFLFLRFMMIALFSFFLFYIGRYHYLLQKDRKESK